MSDAGNVLSVQPQAHRVDGLKWPQLLFQGRDSNEVSFLMKVPMSETVDLSILVVATNSYQVANFERVNGHESFIFHFN